MKVTELKKTIGGYRTERLRRLVVEMYKAMPKRVKEDHGIDDMICSPASKRNNRKSEVVPDIGALESETERFVAMLTTITITFPILWFPSATGHSGGLQFCAYSRTSIMQL